MEPNQQPKHGGAGMAMLAATAVYCVLELAYNLGLAVFVSSASTTAESFDRLEIAGKLLASCGLTMVLSGFLPTGRRAVAAAIMIPALYVTIAAGFDRMLDSIPEPARRAGMHLGAWRNMVVNGDLSVPGIDHSKPTPAQTAALANVPLLLPEGRAMADTVLSRLTGAGPGGGGAAEIGRLWETYSKVTDTVASHYPRYAVESKKFQERLPKGDGVARDKARVWLEGRFREKAGGIPPGLGRDAFVAAVLDRHPRAAEWKQTVVIPPVPKFGIPETRVADFPTGMDERGFRLWLGSRLADSLAKARSGAEKDMAGGSVARDLIASAFVPPMSMALSQLSLVLNLGVLAGVLLSRLSPAAGRAGRVLPAALFVLWAGFAEPKFPEPFAKHHAALAESGIPGVLWAASISVEEGMLTVFEPLTGPLRSLGAVSLGDGERARPVRIATLAAPDISDLPSAMPMLGGAAIDEDLAEADRTLVVDEARLSETGYYGQRAVRCNPYTDKNCS